MQNGNKPSLFNPTDLISQNSTTCTTQNLEGGSFTGDPEGYVEKALGTGISLSIGALLGNLEGGSFTRGFERCMTAGSRNGASLSAGAL